MKQHEKTFHMKRKSNYEVREDFFWKTGCVCPAIQDGEAAVHGLPFLLAIENMSIPPLTQTLSLFDTELLDDSGDMFVTKVLDLLIIPWSNSNIARYGLLHRNTWTSSFERMKYKGKQASIISGLQKRRNKQMCISNAQNAKFCEPSCIAHQILVLK